MELVSTDEGNEDARKDDEVKAPEKMERTGPYRYIWMAYDDIWISDDMTQTVEYLCQCDDPSIPPKILLLRSIIITLRGVSQVYLCSHPLTAILILIGQGFI
jgi:hypothetical protein